MSVIKSVWILTSEYNDYDQHGEYFETIFFKKPTIEDISYYTEEGLEHAQWVLETGGGRRDLEDYWYNLVEYKND